MNKSKDINKRTKKIRQKNIIGGVKILNKDGILSIKSSELHNGKDFFRKMTNDKGERRICKLLMKNPHKNIIKIYKVGTDFIDMELLNTDMSRENMNNIKNVMFGVKEYLQGLGIIYIDWKLDNIGISQDGEYKLFDFNSSGLIDIKNPLNPWKINPPEDWSYTQAIKNGKVNPIEIDNHAFNAEFRRKKYNSIFENVAIDMIGNKNAK